MPSGALVQPAQRQTLARRGRAGRSLRHEPARPRGDRRERHEILPVVLEDLTERADIAGAQILELARRNLDARHVVEARQAEQRSLVRQRLVERSVLVAGERRNRH